MDNINSQFAYDTHQLMEDNDVRLSFSGDFTPDLITVLLLMARSNIGGKTIMKKVYNIMIESLENLTKHALKNEGDKFPAMFLLGKDDHFYHLATGNKISNHEVAALNDKLERINNSSKTELRDWYNEILMADTGLNEKGGAGLGLIDIALKSGQNFDFRFQKIDDLHSFFTLKIKIEDVK